LVPHPIARLFPELSPVDFAALKEDVRRHGVKLQILLHGGQILDGRQRYRVCQELGIRCPFIEWNGYNPWLEVQSRNLLRRQLAKEQVYAIRKLAAQQFPEIAVLFETERAHARERKAQARGEPRGHKALLRSQDRFSESADVIGAQIGVSGSTVKRVDRLARVAPQLLHKVAAGEMSVKRALRDVVNDAALGESADRQHEFAVERVAGQINHRIRTEFEKCPAEKRASLLWLLQEQLQRLLAEIGGDRPDRLRFGRVLNAHGRATELKPEESDEDFSSAADTHVALEEVV